MSRPLYYDLCPNKILCKIENVFTLDECKHLISISEKNGYNKASLFTDNTGVEHYMDDTRSCHRSIIDDPHLAKLLERRIWDVIPKLYNGMKYHSINERFRFLKYDGSGHFKRHTDGQYKDKVRKSHITILIYLNDLYTGGFTTFYPKNGNSGFVLNPKPGMVCLMDQDISHEVPPLIDGIKYVIRTELMYIP